MKLPAYVTDKRGVGKNLEAAIPENKMRFDRFVNDAAAWAELLTQKSAYSKVGIIGHSQGSLVGMLAAICKITAYHFSKIKFSCAENLIFN